MECTRCLCLLLAASLLVIGASAETGPARGRGGGHRKLVTSSEPAPDRFSLSGGVGVTHCSLPGILSGEHIHLHVWIRAYLVPPATLAEGGNGQEARGGLLRIKGFGFIENIEGVPKSWKIHLEEHSGGAYAHAKNETLAMYIRPIRRHNMSLALNVSYAFNSVISLSGTWDIAGASQPVADGIQLLVQGFKHMCNVLPSTWGQQRPDRLDRPGQTVMLISPFFDYTELQVAALLAWHMTWHEKFGVDLYVVYATDGLLELQRVPLIQALVQAGKLRLVLWQDLALPDKDATSTAYARYAHQTIIYNHAVLALHAAGTVIMVADLDEYLVTPRPMTAKQVVKECIPGKLVGALKLERQNAFLTQLPPDGAELPSWTGSPEVAQASALPPASRHPLRHYSVCSDRSPTGKLFKSVYQVMHVSSVHIHYGLAAPGAHGLTGPGQCAKWLHIANQARWRYGRGNLTAIEPEWLWPLAGR